MSCRWLIRHALRALLIVAVIQPAGPEGAQAQFFYDPFLPPVGPSPAYYVGYVASQGIPLSEDGQPIVVEYDAQGQVVGTVDVQPGMLIKSTQEWNSWVSRWQQARTEYEDAGGSTLELTRGEYDAAGRKCLDAEANEVLVSSATALSPEIQSVLVVRADAGLPACEGYILATSPLSEPRLPLAPNASVVVDGEWRSQQVSEPGHYFALETGYFDADASGCPEQSGLPPTVRNVQAFINCPAGSVQGVYAPVHGAEIETTSQNSFITVVTSETGYYQLPYMSYGNVDDWSGDWVSARLAFARPDPRLRTVRFFSLRKRGAGRTVSFAVDTVYLQAHARLMNYPSSIVDLVDPDYQFEDFTQYAVDPEGARHQDQGLLVEISAQDLRETDIYLFRVADNKLIGERRGMSPNELSGIPPDLAQFPTATAYPGCLGGACLSFVLVTRGPALSGAGGVSENNAFLPFASRPADGQPGLEPEYPDSPIRTFLRPGDAVKLVAINRSTGYTGVALGKVHVGEGGLSVITSPDDASAELVIDMFPPNLRVRANRQYEVEYGATAGEERNYIVGFEGSALNTDQWITIRTEWFAPDGSALPDGLPGMTGRLARVQMGELQAGGPTDAAGQAVGQFSIEPGIKTSVVRLPEEGGEREHYYIHVDGAPLTSSVDFAGRAGISRPDFSVGQVCYYSAGDAQACFDRQADEPELQSRPGQFVPFKVPVYDKAFSEEQRAAFLEQDLEDPGPVYRWPYRPEMQFTVHELQVEDVYRVEEDGTEVSVIADANPVLTSTAGGIDYTLFAPLDDPLSPLSPTVGDIDGDGAPDYRAFGWEFGGYVSDPVLSGSVAQEVLFETFLEDPDSIDADDFMALRLIQLGDEANVLWEFASALVVISPEGANEVVEVSADEREQIVTLFIFDPRPQNETGDYLVRWQALGAGTILEPPTGEDSGPEPIFGAVLSLPTQAGATAQVSGRVTQNTGETQEVRTPTFLVTPGAPASIDWLATGDTAIGGVGGITATAIVRDQFGNLVPDSAVAVYAEDLQVTAPSVTDENGELVLELLGGATSGDKEVTLVAGDIEVSHSVEVHAIDFSWTIPPQVEIQETLDVTLTATSTYPGDLSGTAVDISAFRGALDNRQVVLGQSGGAYTATAQYYAGLFPGNAELYARIESEAKHHEFEVVPPPGVSASRYVIAADRTGEGTFDTTLPSGDIIPVSWTSSTTLTVQGTPGSTASVSVGSLAKPLIEPLVDYPFVTLGPNGEVYDRQLSLDAGSTGLSIQFGGVDSGVPVARLDGTSRVEVPNDALLDRTTEIGFGIKLNAAQTGATVANYALVGLRLFLTNDGSYRVEADTANGVVTVESAPVTLDTWHEVGVAFRNGQLMLEVDDTPYAVAAVGNLTPSPLNPGAPALVLGEGYIGLIEWFRVNDWTRDALIEFGETDDGSLTIGPDGTATVTIQATGAMTASATGYEHRLRKRWEADDAAGYVKIAHAQGLPAHCSEPLPTLDEFGLDAMERFNRWRIDCDYGQQIRDARVRVERAGDQTELHIGLARLGALKTIQSLLILSNLKGVATAKCIDGFLLGGGGSAPALICDVVSGFYLYGDVRDHVLQDFYWAFGTTDEDGIPKFDREVYIFANLGIIGSLLTAAGTGAAVLPGIVAGGFDLAVSGARVVAKRLRIAGKAAPVVKFLATYVHKNVLKLGLSNPQRLAALGKAVGVMELLAVVVLLGDDFVELGGLIVNMVQAPGQLDKLMSYVNGYMDAWELGLAKLHPAQFRDGFLRTAYAAILVRAHADELLRRLRRVTRVEPGQTDTEKMGRYLMVAIDRLERLTREGVFDTDIIFKESALRAFYVAGLAGGSLDEAAEASHQGVEKLARFADLGPDGPSQGRVLKALGAQPVETLSDDAIVGLDRVLSDLGSPGYNNRKGAAGTLIAFEQLGASGHILSSAEDTLDVLTPALPGRPPIRIAGRKYDGRFDNGSLNLEMKMTAPSGLVSELNKQLRWKISAKGELVGGEFVRDVIREVSKPGPIAFTDLILGVDHRAIRGANGELLTGLNKAAELRRRMLKGATSDTFDRTRTFLAETLNLAPDEVDVLVKQFINEIQIVIVDTR